MAIFKNIKYNWQQRSLLANTLLCISLVCSLYYCLDVLYSEIIYWSNCEQEEFSRIGETHKFINYITVFFLYHPNTTAFLLLVSIIQILNMKRTGVFLLFLIISYLASYFVVEVIIQNELANINYLFSLYNIEIILCTILVLVTLFLKRDGKSVWGTMKQNESKLFSSLQNRNLITNIFLIVGISFQIAFFFRYTYICALNTPWGSSFNSLTILLLLFVCGGLLLLIGKKLGAYILLFTLLLCFILSVIRFFPFFDFDWFFLIPNIIMLISLLLPKNGKISWRYLNNNTQLWHNGNWELSLPLIISFMMIFIMHITWYE